MAAAVEPAAAPAPEKGREELPQFIQHVFYPKPLASFRESMEDGHIQLLLYTGKGDEPRELTLRNMFPFMTLQDVKLAIYEELKRDDSAIPEFVYLATHGPSAGKKYLGGRTAPVDFSWNLPGISSSTPFLNIPPFEIATGAQGVDSRFVNSTGERRIVSPIQRERLTIEDAFFKKGVAKGLPVLHAYLYKDMYAAIPGAKPPSEKDWNGRLWPYFPYLVPDESEERLKEFRARAQRLATIFTRRQQFLVRLESMLESGLPLLPITLAGIRFLRLTWGKRKEIPGIEAQFYEAAVAERRPFLRLLPAEGSGISKVYLKDGKTPDIQDPKLLLQWSQEVNPTPEQDYAFGKILIRRGLTNIPPIYATLRLFNDGSADTIVEPPRGMKKLDPRTDLDSFGESLLEGLSDLPYLSALPDIGNAALVLGVRVKKEASSAITARVLKQRLPVFSALFQEITPLAGENPLAMLRFKLVSNFATEDRIQTFITQVMNRKVLRGDLMIPELVELVADEFQLDMAEARKRVAEKLQNQGEVALVVPETKDYMLQYNPGIDIAIFAQHPFYTFHLYRVDSLENLQRVVTALAILMSASSDDLEVGAKAVKELRTAELAEAKAGTTAPGATGPLEGEEEAAAAPPPVATAQSVETEEAEDVGGADEIPDYLDDMMFNAGDTEEYTLAEEYAAEEAAAAAAVEGAPYPEPPLLGELPTEPTAVLPDAAPAQQLRARLAAATEAPKDALAGIAAVKAPAAAAAAPPSPDENALPENTGETADKGLAQYFARKLQEADMRLFRYDKTHPSLKRYVAQCSPTYGRQPAVLSEEKFQEMQEEYAKDGVAFHIYPLEPGEPEKPPGVVEKDYYTVLRYGTSPQKQNYYLCSRYFCTRDEMLVREVDLESTQMRRPPGAPKKPGECPFCHGTVIRNQRAPGPNETILERTTARMSTKRHLYIRFLGKTVHPEGFYLPCCFIDEEPIRFKAPAFDKYREWGIPPRPGTEKPAGAAAAAMLAAPTEDEEEEEAVARGAVGPRTEAGLPLLDYYVTLAGVTKKYIIGAEKLPLEIGTVTTGNRGEPQIGLLPTALDSYFDQDPTQLVSRAFNPQKIKPDGTGFLRIGVENRVRYQNDSLLAAFAPYFLLNSAEQMKALLIEKITPRVFLGLNYGNLALEFYDPADTLIKPLRREELKAWASDELDVDWSMENDAALQRAYLSYTSFIGWLRSDKTKKEFRHFALLMAQSGLMRKAPRPGITFIVLDVLKSGKMEVRCPPFGYNADLMGRNDVGFLFHHWSGIWEPIFYVDNRSPEERGFDIFTMLFQTAVSSQWPPIVNKRLQEFMAQCNNGGRGIYTSQSRINSMAMIPASVVRRVLGRDTRVSLEGVLRDSYNHLAALLYKEKSQPDAGYIPVPVIDDGDLLLSKTLMMDWDDPSFKRAPINLVLQFYKSLIEERFSVYPGFSPVRIVKSKQSGVIEAVQLRNGLYVPCGPPSSAEAAASLEGSPTVMVEEMEWSINHEICLEEKEGEFPGLEQRMEIAEFHEIFEHLRLTFSNWLATHSDGGAFRKQLEEVIFHRRIPLVEKRKRMEILLSREVEKWITTDFTEEDAVKSKEVSLLRADCLLKDEAGCSGRCVWRKSGEEARCMLHVPKEIELGESTTKVSAPRVLLLRLIEELLRYGDRRRQLLEQDVNILATLEKPITIGKQRIYPEKSAEWFELLRLDWAKKPDEAPRYLEEMSRSPSEAGAAAAAAAPLAPEEEKTALPPRLQTLLHGGETADPKTGALRLIPTTLEGILTTISLSPSQLKLPADAPLFTDEMIRELTRMSGRILIQIDLRQDPPVIKANKPFRVIFPTIPVIVITEDGPRLLVLNPEAPALLTKEAMPKGLLEIATKAKGVLGLRPPGAAAAAPAAPAAPAARP